MRPFDHPEIYFLRVKRNFFKDFYVSPTGYVVNHVIEITYLTRIRSE